MKQKKLFTIKRHFQKVWRIVLIVFWVVLLTPANLYSEEDKTETAEIYFEHGNTKLDLKDYYGAIADYTKVIELDPEDAEAYYNRGIAKDDLKDYKGTIADYTKAIQINPEYADAYYTGKC